MVIKLKQMNHYCNWQIFKVKEKYLSVNLMETVFYTHTTTLHKRMAENTARNKGKNIVVTGYPGVDNLVYGKRYGKNVWKNPNDKLKRIIWASHHTIDDSGPLNLSCFLKYYQLMLDLADKYRDKIQIAFKPHPVLKVKLYNYKGWGPEKTNQYYQKWQEIQNGQLETSQYLELFNSSDAMILDSASFIAEYLYCGKPSLFTFSDKTVLDQLNEFGKLAIDYHYHAYNEIQVEDFINNVVCQEQDVIKEKRDYFYNQYLKPKINKTASENIYDYLCKSFFDI